MFKLLQLVTMEVGQRPERFWQMETLCLQLSLLDPLAFLLKQILCTETTSSSKMP